ncbi:hypothetical protein ACFFLM_00320 [Deinococcus oregonensis]|uniref:Uncharacterized protein n=1 Tax=Deinococcus oregonensis TaxID=1805970 RepID=A0ABV6ASG7_9DEIO
MDQEMLSSLFFPLLFSLAGSVYAYVKVSEKAEQVLLVMVLFQVIGSVGYILGASTTLFVLLAVHAMALAGLMVHRLQLVPVRP